MMQVVLWLMMKMVMWFVAENGVTFTFIFFIKSGGHVDL